MKTVKESLVRYYLPEHGWYVGYLVEMGTKWAKVRRILPVGAKPQKRGHLYQFVTVPVGNIQLVEP